MNKIISGPCSIESRYQFEKTLIDLLKLGVSNIRAGVWKPRTNQGEFEGLGEDALKIIKEMKINYNFNSFIEVANKEQIELAEKYNIDCFWIGSRTVCNPFSIKEIVTSIKDKNKLILIKNPMNYDINLWVGAFNRFIKNGFTNVKPIFRGFNEVGIYRNQPYFECLEVLKKEFNFKNNDFIIDVSHIAGDRKYLKELINKSKEFGYDNFIIETHYNPTEALTDSKQQIKPNELNEYLNSEKTLDFERNLIDDIDNKIVSLLKKRLEVTNEIGIIKSRLNIEVLDEQRKKEVLKKYADFNSVYEEIHNISVKNQLKINI